MSEKEDGQKPDLHETVYMAIGAGSTCWVGGTGDRVFDSERAAIVAKALVQWVERYYTPKPMRVMRKAKYARGEAEDCTECGFTDLGCIKQLAMGRGPCCDACQETATHNQDAKVSVWILPEEGVLRG